MSTFKDLAFTGYANSYDLWAAQQWAATGGLTNPETARALGMSERSVERQWAYAKSALLAMVRKQEKSQEIP